MDDETEIEAMNVALEIANAKADLAIQMFMGLFSELYRNGTCEQTISQLASVNPKEEAEEADPAAVFALVDIKSIDPDDRFDSEGKAITEKVRLRKMILKNLRDHDQRTR